MEGEAESCEQVKPIAAVKELNGGNSGEKDVGKPGSGHCPDFLAKKLQKEEGTVATWPPTMPTSGSNAASHAPSQLTIFYGGSVCVFDGIPIKKVREIMLVAATAAAAAAENNTCDAKGALPATDCPTGSPVLTRCPSLQSTATATATALASPVAQGYPLQRTSLCKLQAELPIARRHSLQRFFEKRRDRLVNKNPYSIASSKNAVEDEKANLSAATSPGADCFEKSHMPQEEPQPNAAAHLA